MADADRNSPDYVRDLAMQLENAKAYARIHELREMISWLGWGEEDE